jgi:hypothetical protein
MKGLKAYGRRNLIAGFFCTSHFLEMAWIRKIEIERLQQPLNEISSDRPFEFSLIVPLQKKDKDQYNAVIVRIKQKAIITAFFTQLEGYMGKKPGSHFILSKTKY